eukprot:2148833-Heterocapsa_arctica.AAC.1
MRNRHRNSGSINKSLEGIMELVILKESQMKTQMAIKFLKSEWTNKLLEEIMELVIYLENKMKTLIK